jgi:hypothetical protein
MNFSLSILLLVICIFSSFHHFQSTDERADPSLHLGPDENGGPQRKFSPETPLQGLLVNFLVEIIISIHFCSKKN